MRRAEQARHACKSTTRARLSGETSSKEQGFGREETGVRPDNTGDLQAIYRKGVAGTRLARRKPAVPARFIF
ncbi:MAG TPA: hypothetical protein VKC16_06485, partial [Xanthobacteraceae bacterium]|nr:hypothetical protein [Xanthobacteraceae bacterium]